VYNLIDRFEDLAEDWFGVKTHHWDDFLLDKRRERNELEEESKVELQF
jgi:hypothetical protein